MENLIQNWSNFEQAVDKLDQDMQNKTVQYQAGDMVVVAERDPVFCFHFYPSGCVVRVVEVNVLENGHVEYMCTREDTAQAQILYGSEIAGKFNV